jgi:hypothetical protein
VPFELACGDASLWLDAFLAQYRVWRAAGAAQGAESRCGGGCASPGPPLPPSLKLPEVVTDLKATRVGDEVQLRWTTPARTTDKLKVTGAITAEICRETPAGAVAGAAAVQRPAGVVQPCSPVARLAVKPGASETTDRLTSALAADPVRLIAYKVQLRNAAGRTAGPSAAALVASGPAPGGVEGLRGSAAKVGAVLEWRAESAQAAGGADSVELDRVTVGTPGGVGGGAGTAAGPKNGSAAGPKEPAESRFRVGGGAGGLGMGDPGGAIDRTAVTGASYRYSAVRVRTVVLDGKSLEVRSVASASVPVEMRDVFPPNAPVGLVASPGFAGGGAADQVQKPAVDLSWEPGTEARIAGYRVYRRDAEEGAAGAWGRLNAELAAVAAYRDLTVGAGRRYGYRVTAVDAAGNESAPSDEVVETAPGP